MTERPILFSAPMVRALLAGTKTQTRRAVKYNEGIQRLATNFEFRRSSPYPLAEDISGAYHYVLNCEDRFVGLSCPYGQPGDLLWVRESGWERPERTPKMMREGADTWAPFIYDADYWPDAIPENERDDLKAWGWKRRPSIHLPRLGSRILLEIVAVRVERLQDISEADAKAEGVTLPERTCTMYEGIWRDGYRDLWESINGPGSWDANPWVWVIEFRRTDP